MINDHISDMNLFNHILLKIIIPSIIFSTILGCTTNKKQETNQLSPSNQITENKLKPPSSNQDTEFIKPPSVVFYKPDSLQLINIKSLVEGGELIAHICRKTAPKTKITANDFFEMFKFLIAKIDIENKIRFIVNSFISLYLIVSVFKNRTVIIPCARKDINKRYLKKLCLRRILIN